MAGAHTHGRTGVLAALAVALLLPASTPAQTPGKASFGIFHRGTRASTWRHGKVPARATMRAPASTAVKASQKGIVKCGDGRTSARTRRRGPKAASSNCLYRRFVGRLGHAQAIRAVAHRLCRLVWKILHDGVTYEESGPVVSQARAQRRAAKILRELRRLGYRVELVQAPSGNIL